MKLNKEVNISRQKYKCLTESSFQDRNLMAALPGFILKYDAIACVFSFRDEDSQPSAKAHVPEVT